MIPDLLTPLSKSTKTRNNFIAFLNNLLEEGVDLAVRIGALTDSSMIATNVGEMRRVVCASPELLKRTGDPRATGGPVGFDDNPYYNARLMEKLEKRREKTP